MGVHRLLASFSIKMSDAEFAKIYYQPKNLWKGKKAITLLNEETGRNSEDWLSRQAYWQIHQPAPSKVQRPHFQIVKPNQLHQFDLLYMPTDKLYGNKYKYILAGIDVASRFKVARPLKTKKSKEVSSMIEDIYKSTPLNFPEVFQCDAGTEFKSDVTKLLEKHQVKIRRSKTKYNHAHTAFVENLNKVLAKNLFKIQDAQELNDPEKVSTTWVKHLYSIIDLLNNTKNSTTGVKPKDAIKEKLVPSKQNRTLPPEKELVGYGLYRYLLAPGEEHDDTRKRATDNTWSRKTYRISRIIEIPGNRDMYSLENGPPRTFVKEELMRVPENTELPPDWVQDW